MSGTVIIGCRLPSGILLELANGQKFELAGQRQTQERSPVILLTADDYGITEVDADFWTQWKKEYAGFQPLTSGAIFEAKNDKDAKAIAKELRNEKTGHEPLSQTDKNITKAD
jgi:hypothetical protein